MADSVKVLIQAVLDSKEFQNQLKNTKKQGTESTSKIQKGFNAIGGAATLAAGVLSGVVAVALKNATKKAIDFEESVNKFNQTFKGVEKEADSVRSNLVNNFALSSKAATELLSNTGDLLSGFGLVGQEGLKLSGQVNTLAADIASFANVPVEQASIAITKGLLGERESMKLLGIAILETDVQQRLMVKGQTNLEGTALKAARAQATLELAMEQSKNAIGDFARSSDSTANTLKKIKAIGSDVQVLIGQQLLSSLKPTITEFGKFLQTEEGITSIKNGVKGIVTVFLVLKSTVATVFNVIQIVVDSVKISIESVGNAAAILKEKGIGGLKEAFKALGQVSDENKKSIKKNFKDIGDSWVNDSKKIAEVWKQTNEELSLVQNNSQKSIETSNAAIIENNKLTADELKTINSDLDEFKKLIREQETADKVAQLENLLQLQQQHNDQIVLSEQEKAALLNKLEELRTQKTIAEWKKRLSLIKSNTDKATQVVDQFYANSIERSEIAKDKQIADVNKQVEDGIITREEGDKKIQDIEKKFQKEIAEKKRKQAIFDKVASITKVAFDTAQAIMASTAASPLTFGLPWSAAAGALGAAQIAAIASQPLPQVPSFQSGVNNFSGGYARINESGGEMVQLPGGANVLTNSATKDLLFSPGNRSSVQNVTNETVNTTNNTFNVDGVRDINEFRNELLRTEGQGAFT